MNINDINKIYCICLYENKDRLDNVKNIQQLFNNDKFIIKYATKHKYYNNIYKQLNFDFPGQLGCVISHYEIINEAYNLGYDYIMVCEDDIIFDKEQLELFINNAPQDFDILQFYSLDIQLPNNVIINKQDLENEYNTGIYWYKVNNQCNRFGTVLYILNRNGMKYYLDIQNEKLQIADYPFIISHNYNINHYIPTLKVIHIQECGYESEVSHY